MRILDLTLDDHINKIHIGKIEFDKKTALVGVSGAGKTTIIDALNTILHISKGRSSPGDEWTISFIDNKERKVSWSGKFANSYDINEDDEQLAEILYETITIDDKKTIERDSSGIKLNGTQLPVIEKNKSATYIFRDDDSIRDIYESFQSMIIIDNNCTTHTEPAAFRIIHDKRKNEIIKSIKKNGSIKLVEPVLNINCREKIYFSYLQDRDSFEDFEFVYTSIFRNVDSIKVELKRRIFKEGLSKPTNVISISLKMKDGTIVAQESISTGMFKSLTVLAQLMLSNPSELIVIDEIENSLGVNCLPDVIDNIIASDMQCVFSTHHPRIINDVPAKFWKVVFRKENKINNSTIESISKSTSNHDKFIQLINSEMYLNGAFS